MNVTISKNECGDLMVAAVLPWKTDGINVSKFLVKKAQSILKELNVTIERLDSLGQEVIRYYVKRG